MISRSERFFWQIDEHFLITLRCSEMLYLDTLNSAWPILPIVRPIYQFRNGPMQAQHFVQNLIAKNTGLRRDRIPNSLRCALWFSQGRVLRALRGAR